VQEFLSIETGEASMPNLEAVSAPTLRPDVWNTSNAQVLVQYQILA
jgi:hypothetical protein